MLTEDGEGCRYDGPLEYVSMRKWQFVVLRAGLERACRVCSNVCCHLSNSIKINQSGCCFIQVATFPAAGKVSSPLQQGNSSIVQPFPSSDSTGISTQKQH